METQSIFKYTTQRNGIHYIPHEKIEQFKKDPLFKNDEINEKLKADMYDCHLFLLSILIRLNSMIARIRKRIK